LSPTTEPLAIANTLSVPYWPAHATDCPPTVQAVEITGTGSMRMLAKAAGTRKNRAHNAFITILLRVSRTPTTTGIGYHAGVEKQLEFRLLSEIRE
jgi:hypothetical protein